jgi:hypothetical protein
MSELDERWKKFLKKHWEVVLAIGIGIIGAIIGGILVFLWRVGAAPAALGVPANIGDWTIGYTVTFILNVIWYEFLLVGLPVIAAIIVIVFVWWNQLPEEEKEELKEEPKKSRPRRAMTGASGGGIFGLLYQLTWLIVIWSRGYWNTAFSAWGFSAFVNTMLWALIWDLIIFGIPIAIIVILWVRHEVMEES